MGWPTSVAAGNGSATQISVHMNAGKTRQIEQANPERECQGCNNGEREGSGKAAAARA